MTAAPPTKRRRAKGGQTDLRAWTGAPGADEAPPTRGRRRAKQAKDPSLTIISANITRWQSHWNCLHAAAREAGAAAILAQETRLTGQKIRPARSLAAANGWSLHPSAASNTGSRCPAPGGTAVLTSRERASVHLKTGLAAPVAKEGRFSAALLEGGPGGHPLVLATLYLDPDPAAAQENAGRLAHIGGVSEA